MTEKTKDHSQFKSVILKHLSCISECSARAEPFENIVDTLWAVIDPFLDEDDHEDWRVDCNPKDNTEEAEYVAIMNKIKHISLKLYKAGILPNRDALKNRKHLVERSQDATYGSGLRGRVIESIEIQNYAMRHIRGLANISKAQMSYAVHIDVLWAVLSPYITIEDYERWSINNRKFMATNQYRWNIEKVKICMSVMNKANFLLQMGVVDKPEERAKVG